MSARNKLDLMVRAAPNLKELASWGSEPASSVGMGGGTGGNPMETLYGLKEGYGKNPFGMSFLFRAYKYAPADLKMDDFIRFVNDVVISNGTGFNVKGLRYSRITLANFNGINVSLDVPGPGKEKMVLLGPLVRKSDGAADTEEPVLVKTASYKAYRAIRNEFETLDKLTLEQAQMYFHEKAFGKG